MNSLMHNKMSWLLLVCSSLAWASCNEESSANNEKKDPPMEQAQKEEKIIEVRASAYGSTRDDAVLNALFQAWEQSYGVRLTKDNVRDGGRSLFKLSMKDAQGNQLNVEQKNEKGMVRRVQSQMPEILSYEVLSEREEKDLGWYVEVNAKMHAPRKDALADKITLVITQREKLMERLVQLGFPEEAASSVAGKLPEPLRKAFGNSKEFVFLERGATGANAGRQLLTSNEVSAADRTKLNKVRVADFVLEIQVESGNFKIVKQSFPDTGQSVYRGKWTLDLSIKMVELASQGVLASESVSLHGKGNSFEHERCVEACLKDIQKQVDDKVWKTSAWLTFRLGYPLLQQGSLLSSSNGAFVYQFNLKGPYLLLPQQPVSLYVSEEMGRKELAKAVVISCSPHSNLLIIKTEREITELKADNSPALLISPCEQ